LFPKAQFANEAIGEETLKRMTTRDRLEAERRPDPEEERYGDAPFRHEPRNAG
jgi:hypothetical protein